MLVLCKVEEREAQIQELQDTITELHQDISQKDQDKLRQLQQLHHLESRVKELTEEVSHTTTRTEKLVYMRPMKRISNAACLIRYT